MTHQELNSDVLVWSKAHQPLKYRPAQCLWREWVSPPSLLCPQKTLPHSVRRDVSSQTSRRLPHCSHRTRWPLHQRQNPVPVLAGGNRSDAPRPIHSGQPKLLPVQQPGDDTLLHCLNIHACGHAEVRRFSANDGQLSYIIDSLQLPPVTPGSTNVNETWFPVVYDCGSALYPAAC